MSYQDKKKFFNSILTIYGRKAVEEALLDNSLSIYKLHLAESNRKADIIEHCIQLAQRRNIPLEWHDKRRLSFISKNAQQDQGIALDIHLDGFKTLDELQPSTAKNLLLLDNVTNPQNLGMIIRSVAAGFIDGLIIPRQGCAELGPLVIKASAGSLFKATIFRADDLASVLEHIRPHYQLVALDLAAEQNLYDYDFQKPSIFVLGNESEGVSKATLKACQQRVKIPMNNEVESLNVAITAALIAFHPQLVRTL